MKSSVSPPASSSRLLLNGYSLEMTGQDVPGLELAAASLPPGTPINVTFLGSEDSACRLAAARAVLARGFTPVPHIAARRLTSATQLEALLSDLQEDGLSRRVLVIGGDANPPEGCYPDALAVLRTGLLPRHGVEEVSVGGYPEGHPHISDALLWQALEDKLALLREQGLRSQIITQFGFDATAVVSWLRAVRNRGIEAPVRVGVPGPVSIRRLLGYARRFGVRSSASIVQKYGFSLTSLLGTAGPDRFVTDLAAMLDDADLGAVSLHFYTFGGLKAASDWAATYRSR